MVVTWGGTENQILLKLSKEIWQYLLKHQMAVTAESFQVLWLWRHVGSLETSGSHQNGNFDQKFFNKSARGRERPKNICLYQGCFNNYFSTLLRHPILSFRGSMRYSRFGAIISSMHFPRFALFYKSCKKSVTTKQKKCCLSHQLNSLKSCTPFY